jgi:predicted sulfurtransferase
LTNTRKYSDLPKVLAQSQEQFAHKKQIFAYCTGGVRCEQASKFVQALVAEDCEVYQLHGGIQKYLELYHTNDTSPSDRHHEQKQQEEPNPNSKGPCLFKGKNFVFDPRRTDPMYDNTYEESIVGRCCMCSNPHDDYDDGHAPCDNTEARCCKCRILLLVCTPCRRLVQCWGEDYKKDLPKLFCGKDACSDYQATGANPVSIAQT